MKKIIVLILTTITAFHITAQVDSISMGEKYKNQIFYSLQNGVVSAPANKGWDIAFACSGRGASGSAILINEVSTTLWNPTQDTSAWKNIDTSGMSTTWERLLNSDTTWTNGAFNAYRGASGVFDMGWGVLNPQNNFWTLGDSIYVAKVGSTFKKIWIVSLKQGVWEFKYSDLDGANEQVVSFDKKDYPNRNFIYFNFKTGEFIDREPDNTSWDLTFTKHQDEVVPGLIIPVTSVFSNKKVWSAKSNESTYEDASASTEASTPFTQKIDNIGREWKKFKSSEGWRVYDTIAYFVYNVDSTQFYRLVFTGFEGQSTGNVYFEKELLHTVSINDVKGDEVSLSLYPNPVKASTTILLNSKKVENVNIELIDMTGRTLQAKNFLLVNGINQIPINTNDLEKGIYFIKVWNDRFSTSVKFIRI